MNNKPTTAAELFIMCAFIILAVSVLILASVNSLNYSEKSEIHAYAHAKVPCQYVELTIRDINPGEVAYAQADALKIDKDRKAWLAPSWKITFSQESSSKIKITRGVQAYDVELLDRTVKWRPRYYILDYIPVRKFTTFEKKSLQSPGISLNCGYLWQTSDTGDQNGNLSNKPCKSTEN